MPRTDGDAPKSGNMQGPNTFFFKLDLTLCLYLSFVCATVEFFIQEFSGEFSFLGVFFIFM